MGLDYQAGTSPLAARSNMPVGAFVIAILLIAAVLALIFFAYTFYSSYKKSDKYIQKEKNRKTKLSDIQFLGKKYHFKPEDVKTLWNICRVTECSNIRYQLHDNNDLISLFRNGYEHLKDRLSDEKLSDFFSLLFKLELIIAQDKTLSSTHFIPEGSILFLVSEEGELLPLTMQENAKEYFSLDFPEYIYNSPRRPKELEALKFSYKTKNGLNYNFLARAMRFNTNTPGKILMNVGHTDKLVSQSQRHFKREFIDSECTFSSISVNKTENGEEYIFSQKSYEGKLSNVSAGGCCIKTNLPIKENQHICVVLSSLGIDDKIVGIIRKTRKLPGNIFALHIQFLNISVKTKNNIYAFVYKFEL